MPTLSHGFDTRRVVYPTNHFCFYQFISDAREREYERITTGSELQQEQEQAQARKRRSVRCANDWKLAEHLAKSQRKVDFLEHANKPDNYNRTSYGCANPTTAAQSGNLSFSNAVPEQQNSSNQAALYGMNLTPAQQPSGYVDYSSLFGARFALLMDTLRQQMNNSSPLDKSLLSYMSPLPENLQRHNHHQTSLAGSLQATGSLNPTASSSLFMETEVSRRRQPAGCSTYTTDTSYFPTHIKRDEVGLSQLVLARQDAMRPNLAYGLQPACMPPNQDAKVPK